MDKAVKKRIVFEEGPVNKKRDRGDTNEVMVVGNINNILTAVRISLINTTQEIDKKIFSVHFTTKVDNRHIYRNLNP